MKSIVQFIHSLQDRFLRCSLHVLGAVMLSPAYSFAQSLPTLPQPPEASGSSNDPTSAMGKLFIKFGGYFLLGVALVAAIVAAYMVVHSMSQYRKGKHDIGDFAGNAAIAFISLVVCAIMCYYGLNILTTNQGFLNSST